MPAPPAGRAGGGDRGAGRGGGGAMSTGFPVSTVPPVFRAQVRYWRRHPLQVGLTGLGIALGVAVYTAIRLANAGALASFAEGVEAFSGTGTHRVFAPGGGGVPEALYPRLARLPGARALAPVRP